MGLTGRDGFCLGGTKAARCSGSSSELELEKRSEKLEETDDDLDDLEDDTVSFLLVYLRRPNLKGVLESSA